MAGATLTIDLGAIVENWRRLAERAGGGKRCSAVVKADAYGLGMARVAPALAAAGCETFFVAHTEEALALKAICPDAAIHMLNGPGTPEEAGDLAEAGVVPVLNSPGQIALWRKTAMHSDRSRPASVHVDTGMSRLGLSPREWQSLRDDADKLSGIDWRLIMSHYACADTPAHPLNDLQFRRFSEILHTRPPILKDTQPSLCNSAGLFLPHGGPGLARPGIALYGGNPVPGKANPMRPTVRLSARILQLREIDHPETVGYGATFQAPGKRRVATVPLGYADGVLRAAAPGAKAMIGECTVPVIGRVSMDLMTLDVTDAGQGAQPGAEVAFLNASIGIDDLAEAAGTIGYEILTGLGDRMTRVYVGGP